VLVQLLEGDWLTGVRSECMCASGLLYVRTIEEKGSSIARVSPSHSNTTVRRGIHDVFMVHAHPAQPHTDRTTHKQNPTTPLSVSTHTVSHPTPPGRAAQPHTQTNTGMQLYNGQSCL